MLFSSITATQFMLFILLVMSLAVILILLRLIKRQGKGDENRVKMETRVDLLYQQLETLQQLLNSIQAQQQDNASKLREQLIERFEVLKNQVSEKLSDNKTQLVRSFAEFQQSQNSALSDHRQRFEKRQSESARELLESMQNGMTQTQKQVGDALTRSSEELGKRVLELTKQTDTRLQEISGQVEKRLSVGFEKTTATFADVLKRLTIIDEAQKRITELSSSVVSLQQVLTDKRSRGAFGEVQLAALVRNIMPENTFELQATLSNDKRADCLLTLPEPTGKIAIDAKFPLESFQLMTDNTRTKSERSIAEKQFKQDIRKHIQDISEKYIIPGETSDGAIMFIPAEAVFAEIQAYHQDLVETANSARVWIVSPTTLWAILNTARAVLKDANTREQVHIIQEHLGYLGKDFERFQKRMDNLAKHVEQAHNDAQQVNTSARKITSRFEKIEKVELDESEQAKIRDET